MKTALNIIKFWIIIILSAVIALVILGAIAVVRAFL